MNYWRITGAVLAFSGLLCGAAAAQLDPNRQMMISSDGGDYDPSTCVTRLDQRVEISQEGARLRAGSVVASHYRRGDGCGAIYRMQATGGVFYVTPEQTIRANTADYNIDTDTAVFSGEVIAVRGQDVSTSDRLTLDLANGGVTMSGNVRGVIYPEGAGAGQ